PGRCRSVSVRRPIVNSALSIGTIRRPSASVTTRRGEPAGLMGRPDYNGTISTNEVSMKLGRTGVFTALLSLTLLSAGNGPAVQAAAPGGGFRTAAVPARPAPPRM